MTSVANQHESLKALRQEFYNLKTEQTKKALEYENSKSYEMAYLSYWVILEKGLKIIEVLRKREKLYSEICLWKEYFEGSEVKKPSDIRCFSLQEPEKIPEVKLISEFLQGKLPLVAEIMNTQQKQGTTKWRGRRNDIAHQAMSFGSESKFFEYRNKILDGIDELEKELAR